MKTGRKVIFLSFILLMLNHVGISANAAGGWMQDNHGTWYRFNTASYMQTGWILEYSIHDLLLYK